MVERETECGGHHSDNRVKGVVESQRSAKHIRIAVEPPLPFVVADNDDGRGARSLVVRDDIPADQRCRARDSKACCRHFGHGDAFAGSTIHDEVPLDRSKRSDLLERLHAVSPPVEIVERGLAAPVRGWIPDLNGDHAIAFLDR